MTKLKQFYFCEFDERRPDKPLPYSPVTEFVWQVLATVSAVLGAWYLWWRWTYSLNYEVLWFSLPVVSAESCAFIGLLLYFHNLWAVNDTIRLSPPKYRSEVIQSAERKPVSVDVFLPTFNEDPELTRYSIRDAKKINYPHQIDMNIHILDDGNRDEMREVAYQEGVNYITRETNIGYKAGNLRNGMAQTSGDFIVILDSDTRPFPTLLSHTLGYFRDPDVAWVQTPQWFYDIPEGRPLEDVLTARFGRIGKSVGLAVQSVFGRISLGRDPFVSDPKLFYDVIQRRRNGVNASFCCGAGSVHRREAIMESALKVFSDNIGENVERYSQYIKDENLQADVENALSDEMLHATEITPYKFHVSEDIYTSIILLMDTERGWKSIYHPEVETKMLSPLDMQSWAMQRYKYAGGTLDILFNDNPLFRTGMTIRQKLMFAMTFWSYLAPLWNIIFIMAPIIALYTGISPVNAYSSEFFLHLLPFLIFHEIASIAGTWGINNRQGRMLNLAFFSINLQALWAVLRGNEIKFKVTPKVRKTDLFLPLVYPQMAIVVLTFVGILYAGVRVFFAPDSQALGSFVVNGFWGLSNAWAMTVLIFAAFWRPRNERKKKLDVKNRLLLKEAA